MLKEEEFGDVIEKDGLAFERTETYEEMYVVYGSDRRAHRYGELCQAKAEYDRTKKAGVDGTIVREVYLRWELREENEH